MIAVLVAAFVGFLALIAGSASGVHLDDPALFRRHFRLACGLGLLAVLIARFG